MSREAVLKVSRSAHADRLMELVAQSRLEAMPFGSADAQVRALPNDVAVTVTCSLKHGLDQTVGVAVDWARQGRHVVPHIAARMVRSQDHLADVLGRLKEAGVTEAFVIGGDIERPSGPFSSAGELIASMSDQVHAPRTVGIGAYPEGHPRISADALVEALLAKQPFAHYMATQICFSAATLTRWIQNIREQGVTIPVVIGAPGAVQRRKLVQISLQVGVGASLRLVHKQKGLIKGLVARSHSYDPSDFLGDLAPYASDPDLGIVGLHLFTFNQISETMKWRTAYTAQPQGTQAE